MSNSIVAICSQDFGYEKNIFVESKRWIKWSTKYIREVCINKKDPSVQQSYVIKQLMVWAEYKEDYTLNFVISKWRQIDTYSIIE